MWKFVLSIFNLNNNTREKVMNCWQIAIIEVTPLAYYVDDEFMAYWKLTTFLLPCTIMNYMVY